MAQTLHRILVHVVFSTKDRSPLLREPIRPRLFAYLGGIVRSLGGEPLIVNGVADHVHMLLTLPSTVTLAEAMRKIKAKSSHWMRQGPRDFAWQTGYAAFSVSQSNVAGVRKYIANQAAHHKRVAFKDEFLSLLKRNELEYEERFLWR